MQQPAPEVIAPQNWRAVDFISDLHLAEDTPRAFAAWASYMEATAADAVFILGDLFETWPGDDARHAGFELRCGEVLRKTASKRHVAFLAGNRDFLVGAEALTDWGVQALTDPTVLVAFNQRVLLSHGDELCIADVDYQRVRRMVRNPTWQADVLSKPLPVRRAMAQQMRTQSEAHQRAQLNPESHGFDVDRETALQWLAASGAQTLIHGHTHRPGDERYTATLSRTVLSDWDFDHSPAPRAEVLRWQAGAMSRISPDQAGALP